MVFGLCGRMALVAKNRDALLDMMSTLKRFLKERKVKYVQKKQRSWSLIGKEIKSVGNGEKGQLI